VLFLFSLASFLGAFLLFFLEPLFARMMLPLLGGSPAVWNTAMVFYQAMLLLGYAYVHWAAARIGFGWRTILHLAIVAVAVVSLPPAVLAGWAPPVEGSPVVPILVMMTAAIGLPFFAVAATAPLVQTWLARSGHANPYVLYSAGNLGSLLALLAYPLAIEPLTGLGGQGTAWAAGYGLLALVMAAAAFMTWRGSNPIAAPPTAAGPPAAAGPIPWRRRLHWLALAFVPSSLLLGATTYINTDLAAVPLLWVMPLAIYLSSFVIVFARRPVLRHAAMVKVQSIVLPVLAIQFFWTAGFLPFTFALHLLALFVTAMVCHGELVARRPPAARLTEFYLWIALGGVAGGAFNALLAPLVFDAAWEYPLVLVLAALVRPGAWPRKWWVDGVLAAIVMPAFLLSEGIRFGGHGLMDWRTLAWVGILTGLAMAAYAKGREPLRFTLIVVCLLILSEKSADPGKTVLEQRRSFFGIHRVVLDESREFRLLMHGTTVHGAAHVEPRRRAEPLTYYLRDGPLGQAMEAIAGNRRVAMIGLGAGSALCFRRPGDTWTVFEIDPAVVALARDTRFFHFMADCAGDARVVMGDARRMLAREADGAFDVVLLDAFSSASIPVHLLTREALATYLGRLAPGGVMLLHISNRHLDLSRLVAGLAVDAGLVARIQTYVPPGENAASRFRTSSTWVALARSADDLPAWEPLRPDPADPVWTDDFSNILSVFSPRLP
jgi:hypothetical protein